MRLLRAQCVVRMSVTRTTVALHSKYGEASTGGYTQSPGGFGSPAASQGGDKKGRSRAQQIVPCTVSQLMSAVQAEDVFKVGEVEIAQVTIVGVIRNTDKSTINIQYKVDDMTAAPMDVKQWIDTEDMGVDNSVIPPGSYVKVSGNLRSFQNNRSLVAFSVRVLEDMNEVTSHMLEVVNAHMQQSKPQSMMGGGAGTNMMPTAHASMSSTGSYSGASMMLVNGLSANQNQVLSLIKSCHEPQGISMQDLKQKLSSMSVTVIRQIVDFLSNEGHIFSTIDEDHFRSTDNEA
ncbi:replication protein A 32 kDa subunit isoform X1 [Sinocyclocheilus grahami]|uniref:replication protein A 32 kDa subunit isoform X1 n=1 Tax=Sinocyclocheilus grahami TaxID=75366 RepID=UPI0007AD5D6A|nr:PREDICTED: replication protein A 32 kDa subunit isoform X1 [Sinocyclocheilus grahami]